MREVLALPGVRLERGDQCRFGACAVDAQGSALVRKATGWLSNDDIILDAIALPCLNRGRAKDRPHHRHAHLIQGRPKAAERYPEKLVLTILRALRRSMQCAGVLGSLEVAAPPAHRHLDEPEPLEAMDRGDYGEIYYDEIANLPLPTAKVKEARAEELEYMTSKLPVWERGYTPEHVRQRGLTPVPTRFLDVNKGGWTPDTMSIRSRLVVQETRRRSSIAADLPRGIARDPGRASASHLALDGTAWGVLNFAGSIGLRRKVGIRATQGPIL